MCVTSHRVSHAPSLEGWHAGFEVGSARTTVWPAQLRSRDGRGF
jgi:hypothetical protein